MSASNKFVFMELTKSNEDYLEAIRKLILENGSAQMRDIARLMNVKMPSVNSAVRHLADLRLVEYVQYAPVKLTKDGEVYADKIIEKHRVLSAFLKGVLGIEHDRSDQIACLMEHIFNHEEIEKLQTLTEAMNSKSSEK